MTISRLCPTRAGRVLTCSAGWLTTLANRLGAKTDVATRTTEVKHNTMAPNKPDRGQRKKSADDDIGEAEDGTILHVMEALTDDRVLKLLTKALYRQPLIEKIDLMSVPH